MVDTAKHLLKVYHSPYYQRIVIKRYFDNFIAIGGFRLRLARFRAPCLPGPRAARHTSNYRTGDSWVKQQNQIDRHHQNAFVGHDVTHLVSGLEAKNINSSNSLGSARVVQFNKAS